MGAASHRPEWAPGSLRYGRPHRSARSVYLSTPPHLPHTPAHRLLAAPVQALFERA
jgi:hypothetical protein